MRVVAVSGGFDPIHIGHIRSIKEAKELGGRLIVILTRDDQLVVKKGYAFMPYEERKAILESIKWVDEVVENVDKGIESFESLNLYKPNIFAKGGDRILDTMPIREIEICERIGCRIVYGIGGGKIQSSSQLVANVKAFTVIRNKKMALRNE